MERLIRVLRNPRVSCLQHETVVFFKFLHAEIIVNWRNCVCSQVEKKSLWKASKFEKRIESLQGVNSVMNSTDQRLHFHKPLL